MKFQSCNSNVDVTELASDNRVRVQFWNNAGAASGYVDFDERRLIELRNWINKQLRAIKDQKNKK